MREVGGSAPELSDRSLTSGGIVPPDCLCISNSLRTARAASATRSGPAL